MTILDFTRTDWKYKGVLRAKVDIDESVREITARFDFEIPPLPKRYFIDVLGFIFVDENEDWNIKMRLKFMSGMEQLYYANLGEDKNETFCLHKFYTIPMTEKKWTPNKSGDLIDLMQIIKDIDPSDLQVFAGDCYD